MQRKRSIARAHEIKLLPFAILRCKNILGAEGHFYRTQTEGKETPNSLRKKGKYAGEFSTLNGAMTNTSAFQTNTQICFSGASLTFSKYLLSSISVTYSKLVSTNCQASFKPWATLTL